MPRKRNTYAVHIKLINGDYHKRTVSLQRATTPTAAAKAALLDELHYEIGEGADWDKTCESSGLGWECCGMEDGYGEWSYRIAAVHKVAPEHVEALTAYLKPY